MKIIAVVLILGMLVNIYSNIFFSLGLMSSWGIRLIFGAIGFGLMLIGGYLWAKLKGLHWAWMFTLLLWPIGVLVMPILKDRKQGKTTWGITGLMVLAFCLHVVAETVLGRQKLAGILIESTIKTFGLFLLAPIVIIISMVVANLIRRKKD